MKQCFALYDGKLVWLEYFKGSAAYINHLRLDVGRNISSVLVAKSKVTVLTPEEAAKYYHKEMK